MAPSPPRCAACRRVFEPDEVVYRTMVSRGYDFRGVWFREHSGELCPACLLERPWGERVASMEPRACVGCQRPVVYAPVASRASYVFYYACCPACAVSAARRVHHEPRACPVCGAVFTPATEQRMYCRPACKQAAYRERRAADPPGAPLHQAGQAVVA